MNPYSRLSDVVETTITSTNATLKNENNTLRYYFRIKVQQMLLNSHLSPFFVA
jgi:hypothetical protein